MCHAALRGHYRLFGGGRLRQFYRSQSSGSQLFFFYGLCLGGSAVFGNELTSVFALKASDRLLSDGAALLGRDWRIRAALAVQEVRSLLLLTSKPGIQEFPPGNLVSGILQVPQKTLKYHHLKKKMEQMCACEASVNSSV